MSEKIPYQPTKKEIKKAEGMMTSDERYMSNTRETEQYDKEMLSKIEDAVVKSAKFISKILYRGHCKFDSHDILRIVTSMNLDSFYVSVSPGKRTGQSSEVRFWLEKPTHKFGEGHFQSNKSMISQMEVSISEAGSINIASAISEDYIATVENDPVRESDDYAGANLFHFSKKKKLEK